MENQQIRDEKELTSAELDARKNEMKQYFDEAVPFLEAQHKYEKLLTEISEYKLKRLNYDHQYAAMMYQINNPDTTEEDADEEGETMEGRVNPETSRKLKKG